MKLYKQFSEEEDYEYMVNDVDADKEYFYTLLEDQIKTVYKTIDQNRYDNILAYTNDILQSLSDGLETHVGAMYFDKYIENNDWDYDDDTLDCGCCACCGCTCHDDELDDTFGYDYEEGDIDDGEDN